MKRYASETSVSVEKTLAEIKTLLTRYGATSFGYLDDEHGAKVGFTIIGRNVRFSMPLPSKTAEEFTHFRRSPHSCLERRTPAAALEKWDQACRSRWRALLLCIKAKLEACAVGITTFEQEFLAHIVTGDGRTVAERIIPQLTSGGPLLLNPPTAAA